MKKYYVSIETAKTLKEKGYREECFARYSTIPYLYRDEIAYYKRTVDAEEWSYNTYDDNPHIIDAPELHEVQQWLREVHGIDILSVRSFAFTTSYYWELMQYGEDFIQGSFAAGISYEQALEAGINEALKLI